MAEADTEKTTPAPAIQLRDRDPFRSKRLSWSERIKRLNVPKIVVPKAQRQAKLKLYNASDWKSEASDRALAVLFAFPLTSDLRTTQLGNNFGALALITKQEWFSALQSICLGVSPHVAVVKCCAMDHATYLSTRARGRDGAEPDWRYSEFNRQVEVAMSIARGEAEELVFLADPLVWLTRGPGGRTEPGRPGWTDEKTIKHSDPTGRGPVRIRLDFTTSGPRTTVEAIEDSLALTAGDPDDEEEDESPAEKEEL